MARNKRFYWLKLKADFFDDKRIKKLRRLENGDLMTIIYMKMMLKSITTGGFIYFEGIEDSLEDEIALDINETEKSVKDTFIELNKLDLIELHEGHQVYLPIAEECTGSETESAERMRRLRRKTEKASHCDDNVRKRDDNVRKSDTEKEIEKEKEKEKDFKGSPEAPPVVGQSPTPKKTKKKVDEVDISKVADYFGNEKVNMAFNEFLKARKEIKGTKNTPNAVKLLVNKLKPFNPEEQYNAITESIMSEWKGVFPKHGTGSWVTGTGNEFFDMLIDEGGFKNE